MRLTALLLRRINYRPVKGLMYSGKNRIEPRISSGLKAAAARQLLFEQQNIYTIKNPYLTEEEEYNHVWEFGREPLRLQQAWEARKAEKMFKHKYMDDHLNHLNVDKKWE